MSYAKSEIPSQKKFLLTTTQTAFADMPASRAGDFSFSEYGILRRLTAEGDTYYFFIEVAGDVGRENCILAHSGGEH